MNLYLSHGLFLTNDRSDAISVVWQSLEVKKHTNTLPAAFLSLGLSNE